MDLVGHVLGDRYRVLRKLGAGGMGAVYLAEHVYLGRPTALKILRRDLYADEQGEERFRREAMLAARITHPSVAQIYDFDRLPDGEFILAMEYVEGETVGRRLAREGPFTVPLVLHILQSVATGLDRAHTLHILHRDLKPDNIMLAADGGVKLLDFGVARPLDTSSAITSSGFVVGTPAYMSPEQLVGDALSAATDIYSLGVVVFEMLTGRLPHEAATVAELRMRRLSTPPPPLDKLRTECSRELAAVIARALTIAPDARWPTATAMAEAAAAAVTEHIPFPAPVTVPGPRDVLDRWEAHFEALRFAGRDRELRQTREAWATARAGRTTVLWIEGEEGAGKSSFFGAAHREALADGARTFVGRGYEADTHRAYGPWLPILRQALDAAPGGAGRGAIEALLAPSLHPGPDRVLLCEEIAALLRTLASEGLLFVGMEDLDSCDAASTHLLEFLASQLGGERLLLAVTADAGKTQDALHVRDAGDRLRRLPTLVRICLRPLGYEAVYGWLASALGREPPDPLVRHVYGHSEGNPFFIEQVIRTLVEQGDPEALSDEHVHLEFASAPTPDAVANIVRRRLERLSPAAQDMLQIAAVVGREFDVDLVDELSPHDEAAVLDALDEALAAGILTPADRGGDWYRFTHVKIGQVHAQGMNARRRRHLHARIASVLAGRPDTPPGMLAWHWYHAGERDHAAPVALDAAKHAMGVHDYDHALTYALMAAETAQNAEHRSAAHEFRGDAFRRLDRQPEAAAAYARAQLDAPSDAARAVLRCKELRSALAAGAVSATAVVAEAGALAAPDSPVPAARRPLVLLLAAEAQLAVGDAAAAVDAARAAMAGARAGADPTKVGDALMLLGTAQLRGGDLSGARQTAVEAARVFTATGDGYGAARTALLAGAIAAAAGDTADADAAYAQAARYAERARSTRLIRQASERRAGLAGRPSGSLKGTP
ncbi:MAG: protein kinase [Gemmatimonadota bacterium]|nr:protein kinase [Gemmatimonadota bacterium]